MILLNCDIFRSYKLSKIEVVQHILATADMTYSGEDKRDCMFSPGEVIHNHNQPRIQYYRLDHRYQPGQSLGCCLFRTKGLMNVTLNKNRAKKSIPQIGQKV
jgi:hypothetical protein